MTDKVLPALNTEGLRQQIQRTYNAPVAGILSVCEEMFHLAIVTFFASATHNILGLKL
ncbi:hypothetical protein [Scytonema hofmannii]|uniref:hypothetical protein n=1 Tax=Scytonema hofmannii TaxID=34078 RepID=UPI00034D0B78|nr:hypothetical protein [Scytonema hofmannii]